MKGSTCLAPVPTRLRQRLVQDRGRKCVVDRQHGVQPNVDVVLHRLRTVPILTLPDLAENCSAGDDSAPLGPVPQHKDAIAGRYSAVSAAGGPVHVDGVTPGRRGDRIQVVLTPVDMVRVSGEDHGVAAFAARRRYRGVSVRHCIYPARLIVDRDRKHYRTGAAATCFWLTKPSPAPANGLQPVAGHIAVG